MSVWNATTTMSNPQEKIESLKEMQEWDDTERKEIASWEKKLSDLELEKTILELPPIVRISKMAEDIIETCKTNLHSVRSLNEGERNYQFALKEVAEMIHRNLSLKENSNLAESIEREIDEAIIINKI